MDVMYYSVIQLQYEPHRNERVNIGIFLWGDTEDDVYLSVPDYGFRRAGKSYPIIRSLAYKNVCRTEIVHFLREASPHFSSAITKRQEASTLHTRLFFRQPMPIAKKEGQEVDEILQTLLQEFIYVPGIAVL